MGCKILLVDRATGIILNADGQSWHISGGEMPYIYFDSLAQAIVFATSFVEINSTIEVAVYDEADNYARTITGKTF